MEGAGVLFGIQWDRVEENQGWGLAGSYPRGQQQLRRSVGRPSLVEGLSWVHREKGYFEVGSWPGVGTGLGIRTGSGLWSAKVSWLSGRGNQQNKVSLSG